MLQLLKILDTSNSVRTSVDLLFKKMPSVQFAITETMRMKISLCFVVCAIFQYIKSVMVLMKCQRQIGSATTVIV